MRCQNCGWSNPEGATSCEKCKHPLDVIQNNTITSNEGETFQPIQESLRKTIRENRPYGSAEQQVSFIHEVYDADAISVSVTHYKKTSMDFTILR